MRKYIFIFLFMLCAVCSPVQGQVTGRAVDADRAALEGVTVVMQTIDSTFVRGVITDSSGVFNISATQKPYRLIVSHVGFKTKALIADRDNVGDIVLEADSSTLKGVTVKGSRHIARMVDGRFVYDVDYILKERIVSNAFDVVKEVPGIVSRDDNSLSINGLPGNSVIINGQRSNLDGANLIDYLKSLPADRVKNVEIVYNATPDMRVSGAVINIVLKRVDNTDFSGQTSGQWTNKHINSFNLRGSAFLDTKRWSFYTMYSFTDGRARSGSDTKVLHRLDDRIFDIRTEERSKNHSQNHNIYTNLSYKPNGTSQIDLTYAGMLNPGNDSRRNTKSNLFSDAESLSDGDGYWHDAQLAFTSSRVYADVEYMRYKDNSSQDMKYSRKTGTVDAFSYYSRQYVDRLRSGFSINSPIGKSMKLFYGGGYKYVKNNNRQSNVDIEHGGAGNYSNSSTNEEHTADAYLGFQLALLNNRMTVYASLKDEWYKMKDYTHNTLMPTVVLSYAVNANNYLQASYVTQRNYPSYWSLQDYTTYTSEYEMTKGNPDLRPSTFYQTRLVYMWKGKYVFNAGYTMVNDFAISQSFQLPDKLQMLYKAYNINYTTSWYFGVSAPVKIGKWYAANLSTSFYNERYKTDDWYGYAYDRDKWAVTVSGNNTFTLSQKPKLSITVDGFYKSPTIQGVWDIVGYWCLNGGVQWQSANERFILQLRVNDMFQTLTGNFKNRFETQWEDRDSGYYLRGITLSFTYRFKGYKDRQEKTVDTSRLGL